MFIRNFFIKVNKKSHQTDTVIMIDAAINDAIGIEYTFIKFDIKSNNLVVNIISYNKCSKKYPLMMMNAKSTDNLKQRNEYAAKLEHLFNIFKEITPRVEYGGTLKKRYRKYLIPESIEFYNDYNKYSIKELYSYLYTQLLELSDQNNFR